MTKPTEAHQRLCRAELMATETVPLTAWQRENCAKLADYLWDLDTEKHPFDMAYPARAVGGTGDITVDVAAARTHSNTKADRWTRSAIGFGMAAGVDIHGDVSWFEYCQNFMTTHAKVLLVRSNYVDVTPFLMCFHHAWANYDNTPRGAAQRIWYLLDHGVLQPQEIRGEVFDDHFVQQCHQEFERLRGDGSSEPARKKIVMVDNDVNPHSDSSLLEALRHTSFTLPDSIVTMDQSPEGNSSYSTLSDAIVVPSEMAEDSSSAASLTHPSPSKKELQEIRDRDNSMAAFTMDDEIKLISIGTIGYNAKGTKLRKKARMIILTCPKATIMLTKDRATNSNESGDVYGCVRRVLSTYACEKLFKLDLTDLEESTDAAEDDEWEDIRNICDLVVDKLSNLQRKAFKRKRVRENDPAVLLRLEMGKKESYVEIKSDADLTLLVTEMYDRVGQLTARRRHEDNEPV